MLLTSTCGNSNQFNTIQLRNQCPCPTLPSACGHLFPSHFTFSIPKNIQGQLSLRTSASGSSRNNPRRMSASLCSRIRSPCPQRSKGLKVCFQRLLRTIHNKTIQYSIYMYILTFHAHVSLFTEKSGTLDFGPFIRFLSCLSWLSNSCDRFLSHQKLVTKAWRH